MTIGAGFRTRPEAKQPIARFRRQFRLKYLRWSYTKTARRSFFFTCKSEYARQKGLSTNLCRSIDDTFGHHAPYALYAVERPAHYIIYQYTPMDSAAALRAVLSKHTVQRLRELVRTRINLSGYSMSQRTTTAASQWCCRRTHFPVPCLSGPCPSTITVTVPLPTCVRHQLVLQC